MPKAVARNGVMAPRAFPQDCAFCGKPLPEVRVLNNHCDFECNGNHWKAALVESNRRMKNANTKP